MYQIKPFPKYRKHTLCFLNYAKRNSPVILSTEIDMTRVIKLRQNEQNKLSYISFIIYSIAQIIAKYPLANSFYQHGFRPKLVTLERINAKFTLDKKVEGERAVASAVIPDVNTLTLNDIQAQIDHVKQEDFATSPQFSAIHLLQKLPLFLGRYLFSRAMRNPIKAPQVQGSYTVTTLGNYPIDHFIPLSVSTLSFGMGQIKRRAIVIGNQLEVKPTLFLNMVFDHRVLDGASAAKILVEIKQHLEIFSSGGD